MKLIKIIHYRST